MKEKNLIAKAEFLELTKQAFLKKGYRGVSLRNAASKAGKTTGFIYIYFKDKNDIFEHLVGPLVKKINAKLTDKDISFDPGKKTGINLKEWVVNYMRFLMDLAENHTEEMELLFLKAHGSKFANYKNELVGKAVARNAKEFRKLKRTSEFKDQEVSKFFSWNIVNFVINTSLEVIINKSSKAEIEKYEAEITAFIYNGWKGLVDFD